MNNIEAEIETRAESSTDVECDGCTQTLEGEDPAVAGEPQEAQTSQEMEFAEEDIVGYLVDEDDNEIGIVVMEDGQEVEYYYAEESTQSKKGTAKNAYDLGITREGVAAATKDVNAIARDGIKVANEFKGAFDDIKSALDFKSMFK